MFKYLIYVVVALQCLYSASSMATAPNNHQQLIDFEINMFRLSSSFSAFVLYDGSEKYKQEVQRLRLQSTESINRIAPQFPNLAEQWKVSADYIADKENNRFNSFEQRLATGLGFHINGLQQTINSLKKTQASQIDSITLLELKLEKILALYMSSVSSSLDTLRSDKSIDQLVKEFSQTLAQEKQTEQVMKLKKKWRFIENIVNDPNKTSAPFMTLYTVNNMRNILTSMKVSNQTLTASN